MIGICVLYATNLSSKHSGLQDWMASSLPTVDWIVGGDFNMIEWEGDHFGSMWLVVWRCMLGIIVRMVFRCFIIIGNKSGYVMAMSSHGPTINNRVTSPTLVGSIV